MKIVWNKKELTDIAERMVLERWADPMIELIPLCNVAQKIVLSPERYRKIVSMNEMKRVLPVYKAAYEAHIDMFYRNNVPQVETIHVNSDPKLVERVKALEDLILEFGEKLEIKLTPPTSKIIQLPVVKKLTVGIVGPEEHQLEHFRDAFPKNTEFHVWPNYPSNAAIMNCEFVFVMARFAGQEAYTKAKAIIGKARTAVCQGGFSDLKRTVKDRLTQLDATSAS